MPVLTIPPSADAGEVNELMPFESILCASDFSAASMKALELAIVMGQEADARLIALHALQVPNLDPGLTPFPLPVSARFDFAEYRKDALARLKRGFPTDAVFRCRPETMVVEGHPADAILESADSRERHTDRHGSPTRSPLDRLLFGSTTRRVMRAATCPVLSIRPGQADAAWPASTQERVAALTT